MRWGVDEMGEKDQENSKTVTVAPTIQKFQRLKTIEKEHKDALERAVSLNVPHAVDSAEEEHLENNGEGSSNNGDKEAASSTETRPSGGRLNWEEVVEKLLKKNETGEKHIEEDTNAPH
jgi:hypothetical protein